MINFYKKSAKIFTLLISLLFILSCSNSNENKIIYEVPENIKIDIQNGISSLDLDKLVVSIDISADEKLHLCFRDYDDSKTNQIAKKSNRFLKINDFLIPIVFSEDFVLQNSTTIIKNTGCSFQHISDAKLLFN